MTNYRDFGAGTMNLYGRNCRTVVRLGIVTLGQEIWTCVGIEDVNCSFKFWVVMVELVRFG